MEENLRARVAELESLVEDQQETIEEQRDRIEQLESTQARMVADGGDVKVVGEISGTGVTGVYGKADGDNSYGLKGEVDGDGGYGVYTPDDARIDGRLVGDSLTDGQELTSLVGDGLMIDDGTLVTTSAKRDGVELEIGGKRNSASIEEGDTVDYSVYETFDAGSEEEITDDFEGSVASESPSDVSVDENTNTVTGEANADDVTVTADDGEFTATVDVSVEEETKIQPTVNTDTSEIDPSEVTEGDEDDYVATVELEDLDDVTEDGNEVTVTLVDYDIDNGDIIESETFGADEIGDDTIAVPVDGGEFDDVEAPGEGDYDVEVDVTFEDEGLEDIESEVIDQIDSTVSRFDGVEAGDVPSGAEEIQTFTMELSHGIEDGYEIEIDLDDAQDDRGGPSTDIDYLNATFSTSGEGSLTTEAEDGTEFSIFYTVDEADAGSELTVTADGVDTEGANDDSYNVNFVLRDLDGEDADTESDQFEFTD